MRRAARWLGVVLVAIGLVALAVGRNSEPVVPAVVPPLEDRDDVVFSRSGLHDPNADPVDAARPFVLAIRGADAMSLYEGLPHQRSEREALASERRSKPVVELDGYPFYAEPLELRGDDGAWLTEILGAATTIAPWGGEKLCGGYHPDYALEWRRGEQRYRAHLCFGCDEVKLHGPGIALYYDLSDGAVQALSGLLRGYRTNRPAPREPNVHDR